jgi:hypothetical protein
MSLVMQTFIGSEPRELADQILARMEYTLPGNWREGWTARIRPPLIAWLRKLHRASNLENVSLSPSFWGMGWDPERKGRAEIIVEARWQVREGGERVPPFHMYLD